MIEICRAAPLVLNCFCLCSLLFIFLVQILVGLVSEQFCWFQFVLDMQFVIQVAMNGRFSSRHMRQVVNDVTARAVTAFAATGGDPHRFDMKMNLYIFK